MSEAFDIVTVGSGHNGLVAAAYLAVAGRRVVVLERNIWFGGGVVTRELTVPGFPERYREPAPSLRGVAVRLDAEPEEESHGTTAG